jgi:hypothetical protein
MILKTVVERFKIPFALSLSKGEWGFETHPKSERRKAVHTLSAGPRQASTLLSPNGISAFKPAFLR